MLESCVSESISDLSPDDREKACLREYCLLQPRLINLLMGFGVTFEDAENIYQEVAMKVFCGREKRIVSYNPAGSFRSWVTRVVVNFSMDLRRKQVKRGTPVSLEETKLVAVDKNHPTPQQEMIQRESQKAIEKAALGLPDACSHAMIGHLCGYPVEEMAQRPSLRKSDPTDKPITPETIKSNLKSARQKMLENSDVRLALGLD